MTEMTQQELQRKLAETQSELLSTAAFLASYGKRSAIASESPLFWDLMQQHARSALTVCGETPVEDPEQLFAQIFALSDRISESCFDADAEGNHRYWISWWYPQTAAIPLIKPRLECWITGERSRLVMGTPDNSYEPPQEFELVEESFVALVKAPSREEAIKLVERYYPPPLIEHRFCRTVALDYQPGDRFR